MDWRFVSFDWNQARAFLVTAEEGTLSAAARALGLTQPTLGRQVAALERQLGVTLFERVGRSLALTPAGLDLLEHVRELGDAAGRISLAASGRSQAVEGRVSVTATDAMSAYVLPPIVTHIRESLPGIEIDLVVSNTIRDLRRREADIAIRHVRPEEPDLIARLVRETTAHLYASTEFLDRVGRPHTAQDLSDVDFIGFGEISPMLAVLNALGVPITERNCKLSADSGVAVWEMVKQGLGVSAMVREVGELTPGVECVLPALDPIPVPVWLTTHRELHTSRRIRLVFDLLVEALT